MRQPAGGPRYIPGVMISPRTRHHFRFWGRYLADRLHLANPAASRYAFDPEELSCVDYACKITEPFEVSGGVTLAELPLHRQTGFIYDLYSIFRQAGVPGDFRFFHKFGHNVDSPPVPTFVKTRPVDEPNAGAVLLPLNTVRLFNTVTDPVPFRDKKDGIVWRGAAHQPHRVTFLEKTFHLGFCDVGDTDGRTAGHQRSELFGKPRMSIREQLQYKFSFSIQGIDIATNLGWIMSSNTLCIMPKPKYESWVMEGRLVPGRHYIEVAEDLSDLEDKYAYYLARPALCEEMIAAAKQYMSRFSDLDRQYALAARVVDKYRSLCRSGAATRAPRPGANDCGAGPGRSA